MWSFPWSTSAFLASHHSALSSQFSCTCIYNCISIHYHYISEHFSGCYNACNHMQTSIIITTAMLYWLLHLNLHRFEDNNVATVGKQHNSAKGINHI